VAQRLLLEGADIDELLARVRAEHGPDARIVHAEQKLVGGVAGFFAKRRFEVAVAVDEAQTAPTDAVAALPVLPAQPAAQEAPQVTTFDETPHQQAPTSLEELLALADTQDGLRPAGRPLSTESASFDHLVRDLVARAEPEQRTSSPVPFVPPAPAFSASVPPVFTGAVIHDLAPADVDEAVLELGPELAPELAPEPVREPLGLLLAPPVVERPFAQTSPAPAASPAPSVPSAPAAPSDHAAPSAAPAAVSDGGARQYVARHARRPILVPQRVADLGLPVLDPPSAPDDARIALLEVLADVAVSAPERLTGVQVVVGDGAQAAAVAQAWLAACAEGPEALVTVGAAGLDDDLMARVDVARTSGRGLLVVLPAHGTRAHTRRAAALLAELGECVVTAVVDARWDVESARDRVAALGERGASVEAVAAHGVDEVSRPLRLLDLGLPVTWLDARPATVGAWAAPCLDRWI